MKHLTLLCLLICPPAVAYGQPSDSQKTDFQHWQDYYSTVAKNYEFHLSSNPKEKLKVSPKPLMSYSHPSAMRGTHGAFFVWTRKGRPEVVGSIWSDEVERGVRSVMHEFHSLSREPLSPVAIGRHAWRPTKGIVMQPIAGAAPPKERTNIRKVQARSLARKFTGFSTPDGGKELELRLQSEPIYHYESSLPDVLGGAVFAMFKEWDPEIILLIEARKTASGAKWYFGAGRFNVTPLRLKHRGQVVWSVDSTVNAYPRFGSEEDLFVAAHLVDRQNSKHPKATKQ